MLRVLSFLSIAVTIAAAFSLYSLKYETRHLAHKARALEQQIARLKTDIAIARAERAALSDPARIERLARRHLSLVPADGSRFVDIEAIPLRPDLGGGGAGGASDRAGR